MPGPAHDLGGGPDRLHSPIGHQHDCRREPRDLGGGMADIDKRHPAVVAQTLEIRQDLVLAGIVERGQRLVHQQQARLRQQRAADRDALLFAARQPPRPAGEQRFDPEQFNDLVEPGLTWVGAARREPRSEQQVLAHRQMRE